MQSNEFYRINDVGDKYFKQFADIYKVSFPVNEQRNYAQQEKAFADARYYLLTMIEDGKVLSFVAYWDFNTYIYIEHLAVNPELRGKNIGSHMLNRFAEKAGKTILLEIDPVKDEVSEKRLRFYQKLGYKMNPYPHFHPAYNSVYPPHELLVLSYNKGISKEEYDRFYHDLTHVVMFDE